MDSRVSVTCPVTLPNVAISARSCFWCAFGSHPEIFCLDSHVIRWWGGQESRAPPSLLTVRGKESASPGCPHL